MPQAMIPLKGCRRTMRATPSFQVSTIYILNYRPSGFKDIAPSSPTTLVPSLQSASIAKCGPLSIGHQSHVMGLSCRLRVFRAATLTAAGAYSDQSTRVEVELRCNKLD